MVFRAALLCVCVCVVSIYDMAVDATKIVVPVPLARKTHWPESCPNKKRYSGHLTHCFYYSFSYLSQINEEIELICIEKYILCVYRHVLHICIELNGFDHKIRDIRAKLKLPLHFNTLRVSRFRQRPKYDSANNKKGPLGPLPGITTHSNFRYHILKCGRASPVYTTSFSVNSHPAE